MGITTAEEKRAQVITEGDYLIGAGAILAGLCVVITVLLVFASGASVVPLAGVVIGLLLMAVGYLKKIAAAVSASL